MTTVTPNGSGVAPAIERRAETATILVVDDDAAIRRLLRLRLQSAGYRVCEAADGIAALDVVSQSRIDLVLLDLMMPQLDGYQTLRRLRYSRPPDTLPVIVLSARDGGRDVIEAMRCGASDYETKPPDFDALLHRIGVHLTAHQEQGRRVGRYRLVEPIGSGGMGTVYSAIDCETSQRVALKLLQLMPGADATYVERFLTEGYLASQIAHPNIVRVYEVGRDGEQYFLAMELVEGRDIARLRETRSVAVDEALRITRQIVSALAALEQRSIIHRDVKPENILLTPTGVAKLTDFGIARDIGARRVTETGVGIGSLVYASPEQLTGRGDHRSDIYSLGCTLYFMLRGRDAFPESLSFQDVLNRKFALPPKVRSRQVRVSRRVERLVRRMMHPKPDKRFQSYEELEAALDELLASPRLLQDDWRGASRLGWLGIGLLVLLALAAWWKVTTWG